MPKLKGAQDSLIWTNNHYWLSIGLTLLFMWLKKIELFSPLPWRPLELEDQGVCQFSTHKHCFSAFWAWIKASKPHIQLWVAHFVKCGKVSQITNFCIKLPHCCKIDGGHQVANNTNLWECLSFKSCNKFGLVFLQAFIKDVVFFSLFFPVFFQVILVGQNMFGHINYGFTNMHFIKKDPMNHFWFCPIELRHPRTKRFLTCIIILLLEVSQQ